MVQRLSLFNCVLSGTATGFDPCGFFGAFVIAQKRSQNRRQKTAGVAPKFAFSDLLPILQRYYLAPLKTPHAYLLPRKITENRPIGSPSYVYAALRDVLVRTVDER